MRARLIGPGDPAWREAVSKVPHDVYQLPAYADASAEHEGETARAVLVEDGHRWLLLPLVIRPTVTGVSDATSPYGYSGPVGTDMHDAGFIAGALLEAGRALRDGGPSRSSSGSIPSSTRCSPSVSAPSCTRARR